MLYYGGVCSFSRKLLCWYWALKKEEVLNLKVFGQFSFL